MKKIIFVVILGVIGWQFFEKYQRRHFMTVGNLDTGSIEYAPASKVRAYTFKCDGRIHCSQMTSCEEATFFLKNCPNVKMDGDNDGVPCESQWCISN